MQNLGDTFTVAGTALQRFALWDLTGRLAAGERPWTARPPQSQGTAGASGSSIGPQAYSPPDTTRQTRPLMSSLT